MSSRAPKHFWWELADYAIPETIISREGLALNTADETWIVELNVTLNWNALSELPAQIRLPIKSYLCYVLEANSARTAKSVFWRLQSLRKIGRSRLESLSREEIGLNLFFVFKSVLENDPNISQDSSRDLMSTFRRWYVWCSDAEFPGFKEEVALALEERIIGGGAKGKPVLSNDPDIGPLNFVDDTRIESAIAADCSDPTRLGRSELQSLVAVMLSKSFGLYAAHLQLLDEIDVATDTLQDGSEIHWIETPRLKKRGTRVKVGTRRRRLSARLAECIELLKKWNAAGAHYEATHEMDGPRPLFFRPAPREDFLQTSLAKDAYRWRLAEFIKAIEMFCQRHDLKVRLTPRRLRYTFATRLVDEGCSPLELADALDHTDLQHVMVYFNARGRIVRQLDEAMATRLAPLAMAFIGRPVAGAHQATRAGDPNSVIRFNAKSWENLDDVGSCGSFRHCGLDAPLACYTCWKFEPWLSAPHDVVLSELLRERQRRQERHLDEKIIQVHDTTILAVAEVVRRCGVFFQDRGEMP